jgi:hypothetical protein
MPIIAKKTGGSTFEPAPPGVHAAVCVDVVDLGILEVVWKGQKKKQHKVRIAWQIGEDRPEDGKPYLVQKRYTLSLSEKAALRADLESWRGKPFTRDEEAGFDLETIIGAPCMMNVVQETRDGNTYSNIKAIMPLPKGMTRLQPRDYVRVCDRPAEGQQDPEQHDGGPEPFAPITDEDLPF